MLHRIARFLFLAAPSLVVLIAAGYKWR